MEGTNSFEKGLHRSNSPQMQPEGSYVDALNWIRNDSGRLINEELEEVVQSLTDAAKYTLLGYCPIQDLFVIFFQQLGNDGNKYSEIGLFNNVTKTYERVFNDFFHPYKLNFVNSIDSVARVIGTISNETSSPSGDRVVYFVEKDNKIRRFNIDLFLKNRSALNTSGGYTYSSTAEDYNQQADFNLQLLFGVPYGNMVVSDTGGSLPSGVYSVVFRYRTEENNKTVFGIPTKFYFINDDPGNNEGADGCPPSTQTTKSITINVTNTDLNYPYIEPVIITYEGVGNNLIIKSLGVYENELNKQIIFSDESQYKDSVSTDEINESPVFYESAQSIEQKDNILILSNLKGKKYDTSFQEIANKIEVFCYYENIDITSQHVFQVQAPSNASGDNYCRYNYDIDFRPENTDTRAYKENYPYKDNSLEKGFRRGEVYSFSITPIYKDGSIGFAYHIPAKDPNQYTTSGADLYKPSVYTSNLPYPDYIKDEFPSLGDNIRHHKMPDYGEDGYRPLVFPNGKYEDWFSHVVSESIDNNTTPSYNYLGGINSSINILRVKFQNIDFSSQADNIQGYIISYQPRNSDANKSIIDNGWARPYTQNGNIKRGGVKNGSVKVKTTNGEEHDADIWNPYYQYFSPTSHPEYFNRDINTSYYLQLYGIAYNYHGDPLPFYQKWSDDQVYHFFSQSGEITNTQVIPVSEDLEKYNQSLKSNANQSNYFYKYQVNWNLDATKSKIKKVIKVPNVGDEIYVDGKYRVKSSTGFVHIQTENNIFSAVDWPDFYVWLQPSLPGFPGFTRHQIIWNEDGDFDSGINYKIAKFIFPNYLLFRIINDNDSQYGRLEDAEYVPKKVIFKDSNNTFSPEESIEGDIYVTKYWQTYRDFIYEQPQFENNGTPLHTLVGIWYESDINFHMRHREDNGYPYYPKTLKLTGTDSITTGQEWWKQSIGYNKQYSAESNIKKTFTKPLFFNEVINFPNRSVYSNASFENELVDQYRVFPSLQYHDIPKDRGAITDTFVFNNNFYHHTEYGLWLSYFNPNTLQSTTQGNVVLGNAGIFRIPSKLVLDIKGGYMGTLDKSGTNTPFGRVFLDHKQGKVFLLTGEAPMEISDLGLFSFFREFVNTNDEYCMGYDWANKRLLINNITQEKAISFYPKTQTWTSFHTFSPKAYFTTNGYSYAFSEIFYRGAGMIPSFFNMDNLQGKRKGSHITFVENTSPDIFKRFDRIEMNTMSGGNQGVNSPGFVEGNYIFNDKSFTNIHAWTDRQNTLDLPFSYSHDFNTNFLDNYNPNKVAVNYYRSSFHAEIPLDAVVDPYSNIFDGANTNINADFRAHMKGKFLYTKLSYNDDKPLVLNYVKIFFKPTVA